MTRRQIHNLTVTEVFGVLRSQPEGLGRAEVERRIADVGENVLSPPPRLSWLGTLGRQFSNLFSMLLFVSAALCAVAERMQPGEAMGFLGWALVAVALLNGAFTFAQAMRAERAMQALRRLLPHEVVVVRDGREQRVETEGLVPGDVVVLAEGDRVPADARWVSAEGVLLNNAPLTGESRAVEARSSPWLRGRLVDSPNLAFAGCTLLRGSGRAVIYATGRRTEFGKVASLSVNVRRPPTPLELEIRRMVHILTAVAVVMGLSFFAYGLAVGRPIWVNLVFMLGIIVANVPEGLLPTFTLALAMGGMRLARRNVLVKSLNAVEALGAVEVICTDKTGTLTLNQLAITRIVAADEDVELKGDARRALLEAAMVASEVHEREGGLGGDPLDVAVATALSAEGGEAGEVSRETIRRVAFDVQRRRAAGVREHAGVTSFAVKGAWEAISGHLAIDEATAARAGSVVHAHASRGSRVIAVAARELAAEELSVGAEELEKSLKLLGFLCLEDPLRQAVPGAVERCRAAGIRVVLVTGDHPDTALSVAQSAGIVTPDADLSVVVTGDVLERAREDELVSAIQRGVVVFARTTPEQKLKIVSAFKRSGLLTAMTGDGVNDAPALRAADIGVAMGLGGTDVAREAAQIVLLDDDFASIVAGVEEGRTVFANMQKFTSYVLASNVPEIVPFLAFVVLPVPLALSVMQILSIDLGTDMVPAIGLGREPPDGEAMHRPPRGRRGRLLDTRLMLRAYLLVGALEAAWCMAMFFWVLHRGGWQWGRELSFGDPLYRAATGVTLISVIFTQVANLVGRRYERRSGLDRGLYANPLFGIGVALELGFAATVLYFPPVSRFLGTAPVPPSVVAVAALGIPLVLGLDYAAKRITTGRARARTPG